MVTLIIIIGLLCFVFGYIFAKTASNTEIKENELTNVDKSEPKVDSGSFIYNNKTKKYESI